MLCRKLTAKALSSSSHLELLLLGGGEGLRGPRQHHHRPPLPRPGHQLPGPGLRGVGDTIAHAGIILTVITITMLYCHCNFTCHHAHNCAANDHDPSFLVTSSHTSQDSDLVSIQLADTDIFLRAAPPLIVNCRVSHRPVTDSAVKRYIGSTTGFHNQLSNGRAAIRHFANQPSRPL